ncbi:MAG: HypC/HybG/HupF family hydrogenase formation chaperone [Lentisphaeria bacterium]|nr:HypC/HybG/HupF family hydrogenase formation chaperone [Lentisphaeria bacterium]
MCVGLSAKVVSVKDGSAVIDASGARRTVSAELLEDLEPGEYVMVHAGVAIARITGEPEAESREIMEKLDEKPAENH